MKRLTWLSLTACLFGLSSISWAADDPVLLEHFKFDGQITSTQGNYSLVYQDRPSSAPLTFDEQGNLMIGGSGYSTVSLALDVGSSAEPTSYSVLVRTAATADIWTLSVGGRDYRQPYWGAKYTASSNLNNPHPAGGNLALRGELYFETSIIDLGHDSVTIGDLSEWMALGFGQSVWANNIGNDPADEYTGPFSGRLFSTYMDTTFDFMTNGDGALLISDIFIFQGDLTGVDRVGLMNQYVNAVPEPSTYAMLGLGLLTVAAAVRGRRNKTA